MRRGRVRGRKKRGGGIVFAILFLLIAAAGVFFVYTSPLFERVAPVIHIDNRLSANNKVPLKFRISDNNFVKSCKVTLSSNGNSYTIYDRNFLIKSNSKDVEVLLPKEIIDSKVSNWDLNIEVRDGSLWGLFMGNKAEYSGKLLIDSIPPVITTVAKSSSIQKGGSALVIYKADDKNLDKSYIEISKDIKFKPIKYKKEGVYATLIVWPFNQDSFNPTIVAVDKAGNIARKSLDIGKIIKEYKVSKIRASDRFINGKITELANRSKEFANISDKIERFRAVNEKMRLANEELIHKYSSAVTPFKDSWKIKPFKPLRRAKRVSDFGSKRFYYYNNPDNIISTSYHVGYDLASIKNDNLYSSNSGVVKFASYNGIYGNMPLIDHKFGLYTLYGHCNEVLIKKGDIVKEGQIIAKTGKSGLALGDHVHFGIVVQGIEVYPLEWMSKSWISTHIDAIFSKADRILGYN